VRVAFCGTPEVAVPSLDAVAASSHDLVAVVTQPDRPRGRGRAPVPSPVKARALELGLDVLQPGSPNEEGFDATLRSFEPDAIAVVAYGHILRPHVLEVAPAVNVHFSLLPAYRGAAPVQRALMDGATGTGVSVFLLEPTVDTGPVLEREAVAIEPDEPAGELLARLAPVGARLLLRALDALEAGTATPVPQSGDDASPAPKIRPEETAIDWTQTADSIANLVRALNPNPGAHTTFRGRRLNVWRARAAAGSGEPGTVIQVAPEPVVAAGLGAVALGEVQPEGKRRMSGADFSRGYRPAVGEPLMGDEPD
jgi:methionyl-tRNA formyltransferase